MAMNCPACDFENREAATFCGNCGRGRDPLGRFDRSLEGFDDAVKAKFFHENFERVFPA